MPPCTLPISRAECSASSTPTTQMLGQEYDLPDVLGVVGERAVERLHNRMRFLADGHGAEHIFMLERIEGGENAGPALLPPAEYFFARCGAVSSNSRSRKTVGLLAIGSQKIGKARARVAGDVLDKNGHRIRLPDRSS